MGDRFSHVPLYDETTIMLGNDIINICAFIYKKKMYIHVVGVEAEKA